MKKRMTVLAGLLAAGTVFSASAGAAEAASGTGYRVIAIQGQEELNQALEGLGVSLSDVTAYCPTISGYLVSIGCEINVPEPDVPETDVPETDVPETDVPETDAPETDAPETDAPETDAPETDAPETDAPGTDVPETDAPETDAPETNVPGADVPGTDAPETDAPETDSGADTELSYAEQILALVNAERAKAGLPALALDTAITEAANVRAREITQSFAHTRPDGSAFSTALTELGISYRGCGENIAWGQPSPEAVMDGWMNSEGHRANILNASFTKLGVGHYQNANGVNYWVQLFVY